MESLLLCRDSSLCQLRNCFSLFHFNPLIMIKQTFSGTQARPLCHMSCSGRWGADRKPPLAKQAQINATLPLFHISVMISLLYQWTGPGCWHWSQCWLLNKPLGTRAKSSTPDKPQPLWDEPRHSRARCWAGVAQVWFHEPGSSCRRMGAVELQYVLYSWPRSLSKDLCIV